MFALDLPGSPPAERSGQVCEVGGVLLSLPKLGALRPDLFGFLGGLKALYQATLGGGTEISMFRDVLAGGDSNPAIVVRAQPLIVAAYTGELDCVAMLGFPPGASSLTELKPGARLLAVHSYPVHGTLSKDLIPGPGSRGEYPAVIPLIADFLTDDAEALESTKAQIEEPEWARTAELAAAYVKLRPKVARDGRPGYSGYPAKGYETSGLQISWT